MATTVDGLATGLDTTKLIEGLLSVQTRRISLLRVKQDKVVLQQTSFKKVEAKLLALQAEIGRLGRAQNGAFDGKLVTSSQEGLLKAAASSSAAPGVYSLRVGSLARAHQIASQGFDEPDATITQGTVQLRVGTGATTTITIDATNNTLGGLAAAINGAGAGVTASVIHDGSDGRAQPYRLLLTSNTTGAANAITLTNGLAADSGGARRPELGATAIGPAVTAQNFSGTSAPAANGGPGVYTGASNKTYQFTVLTGGTVGTTDGIQIGYTDGTGALSGTITLAAGEQDTLKAVAEGLEVRFSAGTLVAGEQFTIDAFVPTVQQATSAQVTLGSGPGALTAQSDTNRVDGLISGVTLDLLAADTAQEIQLTVAHDRETASKAIVDFVDAYNDLMAFIDDQVRYDAETGRAGALQGNRWVTQIQDELRRSVGDLVAGVGGQMNRLGALGITVNSQALLEVNQGKLDDALAGRVDGVTFDDVRRLFALAGRSTSGGVQFVVGGVRTRGSATPYQVDVTQAAERAAVAGGSELAASTVINGSNNSLTLTIDGRPSSLITLAAGTYTRLTLIQELEAQINANAELAGRRVAVSLDAAGTRLVTTSQTYGYASEVRFDSGTALAALGLTAGQADRGQDVAGKYIVAGVDEPAVGTGQFLVGNAGNANTADLQTRITLGAAQVVDGPEASLTVTRGVAAQLDVILSRLLDPVTGRLKTLNDGFQETVDDIEDSVAAQQKLSELRRQSLLRQFAALERSVSELKSTGDFLAARLTS